MERGLYLFHSVLDTAFFRDIEITDVSFVLSKFRERRFRKYQVVFYEGDPGNEMFIVKSGALKIYREDDWREIIFGHQFPGETIGELEVIHYDNRRLASVAALQDSVLWEIKKPDLESLIDLYPILLRRLFYVVSERLRQADRKLEYLAFLDARIRVANLLMDLHSNFGVQTADGFLINWKITQQHLANMIGVSRESAARALQELQGEGIISIQNRLITIHNLSALESLCNVCDDPIEQREWHSMHKYNVSR